MSATTVVLLTPPGVPVTRRGCSRDTDRDGVPDYRDLYPDSIESTVALLLVARHRHEAIATRVALKIDLIIARIRLSMFR
jgi:hypothetical protein